MSQAQTQIANVPPRNLSTIEAQTDLTTSQKAAVIIALLGAENAGPLVQKIEDRHLLSFLNALENLRQIPRDTMLAAVADFVTQLNRRSGGLRGGPEVTRKLAEELFEDERIERLFGVQPVLEDATSTDRIWAELKTREVSELAQSLGRQRGEVVSIVLSRLSTDKAGELLTELPEDISLICVNQLTRQKPIEQRTIDAVAELVNIEFLSQKQAGKSSDSVAFISEVLSILPRSRRDMMLETLEKNNPEQAERIRKSMMTFEDIPNRLPTTAIPILFRDFDQEKLLKALKTGLDQSPDTIEFLYANISQRMAEQFKEQVEDLAAYSQKEGDGAISSLMGFIGKLEKEGRISLIKPVTEPDE